MPLKAKVLTFKEVRELLANVYVTELRKQDRCELVHQIYTGQMPSLLNISNAEMLMKFKSLDHPEIMNLDGYDRLLVEDNLNHCVVWERREISEPTVMRNPPDL